jgi:Flp pilus assembly protein CpaB
MSYRLRNILIAVALAGVAALLVTYYVSNYKKSVQRQQTSVPVVVAAKDIPVGTLGSDVISKGYLSTQQVARKAVVPGAISSPDQIRALVATQPVFSGEQVTTRRFGPLAQQGLKGQLAGSYRAVQLSGDPNQVLVGTLEAGDHVDFEGVVTVQSSNAGASLTFSRIVVRDLKVLQVQAGSSSSGKIGSGTSQSAVMLRMTDAQSQKVALVYAAARGGNSAFWTLELRPGLKSTDSPNSIETAGTLLKDGINPSILSAIFAVAGNGH